MVCFGGAISIQCVNLHEAKKDQRHEWTRGVEECLTEDAYHHLPSF